MNLQSYFNERNGFGVISSADAQGQVNGAIYAKPHVLDDHTIAFITRDRLTHQNLQANPVAHYLFIEDGAGYHGVRLNLIKIDESDDQTLINSLSRRAVTTADQQDPRFLVTFKVTQFRRLIGGEEKLFD